MKTSFIRSCAGFATAVALLASAPSAAWAESNQTTSEASRGTIRFVEVESATYPGPGDDAETFYGFFSLEGVCGFDRARMTLDYTETFLVGIHQQGARAGGFNALGKIRDEAFTVEVLNAAGEIVDTYTGTADELGTARGMLTEDDAILDHSNYTFIGTATNEGGSTLRLLVNGRYRTDPRTGELRYFDYSVQSCRVT